MKYLFYLALKNIIRYKRRTTLTFLVISFGIAFFILMYGMVSGAKDKSIENIINFDTAHLKIRSKNYDPDKPFSLKNLIPEPDKIEKVLSAKKYIKSFTSRIRFLAELDNGEISTPVEVIGIEPQRDKSVFSLLNFLSEGILNSNGVAIGKNLAQEMEIKVGDYVYITFKNALGMYDSIELLVSGIIDAPDPSVNYSSAFITLNTANEIIGTAGVTEIAVKTDNYKKYKEYEKDLKKSLPAYQILNWRKLGEAAIAAAEADTITTYIYVFFIAVIALVGIINTLLMSVLEKKREIGTLKALGMTNKEVSALFVFEGTMIGFFGSVFGVILGVLLNWYFVVHGIDYSSFVKDIGGNIGYQVMGVVKSKWNVTAMIIAVTITVITSAIASYIPARKASKMQPAECLRTI